MIKKVEGVEQEWRGRIDSDTEIGWRSGEVARGDFGVFLDVRQAKLC